MTEQDDIKTAAERLLEHISCGRSCVYRVDRSTPDIKIVAEVALASRATADRAELEALKDGYARMHRVLRDIASGHLIGCAVEHHPPGRCDCSADKAREVLNALAAAPTAERQAGMQEGSDGS